MIGGFGYYTSLAALTTFQRMPDLTAFLDAERPMRHFTAIPTIIIKRFAITWLVPLILSLLFHPFPLLCFTKTSPHSRSHR